MDAGGRAKQEARAENRSVCAIHEDSSMGLTQYSCKKNFLRGVQA